MSHNTSGIMCQILALRHIILQKYPNMLRYVDRNVIIHFALCYRDEGAEHESNADLNNRLVRERTNIFE